MFICDFNNGYERFFINFFVSFPKLIADATGEKKGEREAESKTCGKGDCGDGWAIRLVMEGRVHRECYTWNTLWNHWLG